MEIDQLKSYHHHDGTTTTHFCQFDSCSVLKRQTLLNAGLIEMIKWFSLAARKIIEGKLKLPKQT